MYHKPPRRTSHITPCTTTTTTTTLSLGFKRLRETSNVPLDRPFVPQELHVCPIDLYLAFGALLEVLVAAERGEAPVLGDDDLLAAGELVLRAAEGFDGCGAVWDGRVSMILYKGSGEAQ